ncbi:MAG: hypothetical protein ACXWF0_04395 [Usitatibacter sp.]
MTELEILRRRRELVLLSAELQRATVARRLERVGRHPVHAVLRLVTSVASVPILLKVASIVFGRVAASRKRPAVRPSAKARLASLLRFLPALRFVPVTKIFPVLKSLNR